MRPARLLFLPDADIDAAAAAVALGGYVNRRSGMHFRAAGDHPPEDRRRLPGRPGRPRREDRHRQPVVDGHDDGHADHDGGGRAGRAVHPGRGRCRCPVADRRRARRRDHLAGRCSPTSTRRPPFSQDELFGPAVAVSTAEDWQSAIAQANGTAYGLGAGIFTSDVSGAVRAIREIDAGTIHINWTPLWRADLMPYGGLKGSGIGKEGPRSAVAEMTDVKTVILHGRPW